MWGKVAVESLPSSSGILPIAIIAFQLVLEMHLLRNDKAQSRIVNLEITCKSGKTKEALSLIDLSISDYILDMHGRRKWVLVEVVRIQRLYRDAGFEP